MFKNFKNKNKTAKVNVERMDKNALKNIVGGLDTVSSETDLQSTESTQYVQEGKKGLNAVNVKHA